MHSTSAPPRLDSSVSLRKAKQLGLTRKKIHRDSTNTWDHFMPVKSNRALAAIHCCSNYMCSLGKQCIECIVYGSLKAQPGRHQGKDINVVVTACMASTSTSTPSSWPAHFEDGRTTSVSLSCHCVDLEDDICASHACGSCTSSLRAHELSALIAIGHLSPRIDATDIVLLFLCNMYTL